MHSKLRPSETKHAVLPGYGHQRVIELQACSTCVEDRHQMTHRSSVNHNPHHPTSFRSSAKPLRKPPRSTRQSTRLDIITTRFHSFSQHPSARTPQCPKLSTVSTTYHCLSTSPTLTFLHIHILLTTCP